MDDTAESLRAMASHRGLKLLRSRRRKPGSGDYGKFGLANAAGKPLFGVADNGALTAVPEEIRDYLRTGLISTWQQSAVLPSDRPTTTPKRKDLGKALEADPPPRRRKRPQGESASETAAPAKMPRNDSKLAPRIKPPAAPARPKLEIVRTEPVLAYRAVKAGDAEGVARLLRQLRATDLTAANFAQRFASLRKPGSGALLAEAGRVVGIAAWTIVPTLQHGPVGRVSVLLVDEAYRRRGIGSQLLARAEAALLSKGCGALEVMSDIDLGNSHNFFRAGNFRQTSYRFVRDPTDDRGADDAPST